MEQNIGVMIQDTQTKIAKVLNESGLPASVLTLVVKDYLNQLAALAQAEVTPQNIVELGEGIETPKEEDYDYDNNYTPQAAQEKIKKK